MSKYSLLWYAEVACANFEEDPSTTTSMVLIVMDASIHFNVDILEDPQMRDGINALRTPIYVCILES